MKQRLASSASASVLVHLSPGAMPSREVSRNTSGRRPSAVLQLSSFWYKRLAVRLSSLA
jgi:hypothetical protein